MVNSPSKDPKHLSPLNTNWHNRSMSSISANSDAATFHSAHAHLSNSNMELRPLSPPSILAPLSMSKPLPSPTLESIKMDRKDSGYSDRDTPHSPESSRRSTSTTRTRSPGKSKRRTTGSSATSGPRSSTKRASRSSAQVRTSTSGARPSMQSRHTASYSSQQQYQFFQFPTFSSPSADPTPDAVAAPPPPPPATVQYWTSDSTRRLEYAAIDAASKGVKGLLYKMIPDCIMPPSSRRTRFACRDGDSDSDAGSVRRYRLALPEEKEISSTSSREMGTAAGGHRRPKMSVFRPWTSFGRRS